MPGPTVLDLVGDIREAVERLPKDQLVDILTYVFKEYVVEGPAPLPTPVAATEDSLAGMSFAEVVRSLQLRLDLPELELFDVQGERVSVRVQGRMVPLVAGPAEAASPSAPAAPASPPAAAPSATSAGAGAASPAGRADRPAAALRPAAPAASQQTSPAVQQGPAATASPPSGSSPSAPSPAAPGAPAATPAASQQAPAPARKGGLLEID